MPDNMLRLLPAIEWLPISSPLLTVPLLDWLMEEESMTKRLTRYCQKVTVAFLREGYVTVDKIPDESPLLPAEPRYWLREVLLAGDGIPWLAGRTVVPESTLAGPEKMLCELGKQPLGHYLFSSNMLTRDFIEPGIADSLWGRRSRLRLSDKPLMLTELFLPDCPLYSYKERA